VGVSNAMQYEESASCENVRVHLPCSSAGNKASGLKVRSLSELYEMHVASFSLIATTSAELWRRACNCTWWQVEESETMLSRCISE
jgi:hypothetical protein